jgi:hypothetical protein
MTTGDPILVRSRCRLWIYMTAARHFMAAKIHCRGRRRCSGARSTDGVGRYVGPKGHQRLPRELQLGGDFDGTAYALRHRAPRSMKAVGPLGRLPLVAWASGQQITNSNPLDNEHPILQHDITFRLRDQLSIAGIDLARLQRVPQGPCESTGSGSYHIVESGRVVRVLAESGAVVLANLVVCSEEDWLRG